MPTWPATLPQQLLIEGYYEESPDNIIRSAMDSGPSKQRRRYTASVRPFGGKMLMTAAQYTTFKTFHSSTLSDGAIEFDFPTTGDTSTTIPVKFKERYRAAQKGTFWIVTLELEEQP